MARDRDRGYDRRDRGYDRRDDGYDRRGYDDGPRGGDRYHEPYERERDRDYGRARPDDYDYPPRGRDYGRGDRDWHGGREPPRRYDDYGPPPRDEPRRGGGPPPYEPRYDRRAPDPVPAYRDRGGRDDDYRGPPSGSRGASRY